MTTPHQDLLSVAGVSEGSLQTLSRLGITDLESLAFTPLEPLVREGVYDRWARKWLAAARAQFPETFGFLTGEGLRQHFAHRQHLTSGIDGLDAGGDAGLLHRRRAVGGR